MFLGYHIFRIDQRYATVYRHLMLFDFWNKPDDQFVFRFLEDKDEWFKD